MIMADFTRSYAGRDCLPLNRGVNHGQNRKETMAFITWRYPSSGWLSLSEPTKAEIKMRSWYKSDCGIHSATRVQPSMNSAQAKTKRESWLQSIGGIRLAALSQSVANKANQKTGAALRQILDCETRTPFKMCAEIEFMYPDTKLRRWLQRDGCIRVDLSMSECLPQILPQSGQF